MPTVSDHPLPLADITKGTLRNALSRQYLAQLEGLTLEISRKINMGYNGVRKSGAKGHSLEFSDFREYSRGDDIRTVDWNSYGRFGKLFVKMFLEEKQASINIFLDKSKSMDFGALNKGAYAKLLAASIAYIGLRNTDKVNLFAFDATLALQKTNIATKNLFPQLVKWLEDITFNGETMLNKAIADADGTRLGSGLSVIISDFFALDGFEQAITRLQQQRQDVYCLQVLCEEEQDPKDTGPLRFVDAETGQAQDVWITGDVLKRYRQVFLERQAELVDFCKKRGVTYRMAPTNVLPLRLLGQM